MLDKPVAAAVSERLAPTGSVAVSAPVTIPVAAVGL